MHAERASARSPWKAAGQTCVPRRAIKHVMWWDRDMANPPEDAIYPIPHLIYSHDTGVVDFRVDEACCKRLGSRRTWSTRTATATMVGSSWQARHTLVTRSTRSCSHDWGKLRRTVQQVLKFWRCCGPGREGSGTRQQERQREARQGAREPGGRASRHATDSSGCAHVRGRDQQRGRPCDSRGRVCRCAHVRGVRGWAQQRSRPCDSRGRACRWRRDTDAYGRQPAHA